MQCKDCSCSPAQCRSYINRLGLQLLHHSYLETMLGACLPSIRLLSHQRDRSTLYRCRAALPYHSQSPTSHTRNTELKRYQQPVTTHCCGLSTPACYFIACYKCIQPGAKRRGRYFGFGCFDSSTSKRVLDLLEASNLRLWKVVN